MGKRKDRIDTAGGSSLSQDNPFAGLSGRGLPAQKAHSKPAEQPPGQQPAKKETLLLRRLKSGKGGKIVTEISGFDADPGTITRLLKALQGQLGTGGTCKAKVLELQGDCRDRVRPLLEERGYRTKG